MIRADAEVTVANPEDEPTLGQRVWLLVVLSFAVAVVMYAFATFFSAGVHIARDTGASQTELTWLIDAYTLTMAAFLMPAGALGDRFGRRGVMNFGLAVFLVAAVFMEFASGTHELIAIRALEGTAAALIMPSTLSLITTVFPLRYRAHAVAVWSAVMIFAAFVGVVTTAILLEFFAWESSQHAALGIAVVGFVLGWTIPTSKEAEPPRFDGLGAALACLICGGSVYGLIQGGESSWGDPRVVGSLAVAGLSAIAFVFVELKVEDPMLDVRVFRIRPFAVGTLVTGASYGATWCIFFASLLYMQYIKDLSILEAAILSGGTLTIGVFPMVAIATWVVERLGLRIVLAAGVFVCGLGFLALTTVQADTDKYVMAGYLVIMGAGIGITMAPASAAILEHLPENKQGVGAAVNHASRDMAIAFALALVGSLISAGYADGIREATAGLPQPAREASRESILGALAVAEQSGPAGVPLRAAAADAFVDGMHAAATVVGIGLILIALFVAVWTPARQMVTTLSRGVAGFVRSAAGVPIPGAGLVLLDPDGRLAGRTCTDDQGRFLLEIDDADGHVLVCTADGELPAATAVNGGLHEVTLGVDGRPAGAWTTRFRVEHGHR